jgi:hypothetical protein
MILTIKGLTPRDVQLFTVLWGRLKGADVRTEDFQYTPEPQDYVETVVTNIPTQEAQ